jgi:Uncharacterized protein conserved in bacteria
MAETPEGYLLCTAVPIARTGMLEYLPEEVGIEAAKGGGDVVVVYRLAEDLFAPAAIASFEGKPGTVDHPDEDVTPLNWRDLAIGHAQNIRRGSGANSDLLLADLLITDAEAIRLIREEGLREISCGYDAAYEEISPGVGRQTNIIGNHIALVDAGRCGSRCAIKDRKSTMTTKPKPKLKAGWFDRVFGDHTVRHVFDEAMALAAKDEETSAPVKQDEPQPATDNDETLAADVAEIKLIVRSILELMQGKTGDEDPAQDEEPAQDGESVLDEEPAQDEEPARDEETGATKDRRRTADKTTIAHAAVLSPSLRVLTGDSDVVVKRMALRDAARDPAVQQMLTSMLRGRSLNQVDRPTLDAAFVAAVGIKKARNNDSTAKALLGAKGRDSDANKAVTPADLNLIFAEHRKSLSGAQ